LGFLGKPFLLLTGERVLGQWEFTFGNRPGNVGAHIAFGWTPPEVWKTRFYTRGKQSNGGKEASLGGKRGEGGKPKPARGGTLGGRTQQERHGAWGALNTQGKKTPPGGKILPGENTKSRGKSPRENTGRESTLPPFSVLLFI